MKKIVLSLAVLFSVALVSCGNKTAETTDSETVATETIAEVAVEETVDTATKDTTVAVEAVEATAEVPLKLPQTNLRTKQANLKTTLALSPTGEGASLLYHMTTMDFNWAEGIECAVTICDTDCKILFMNRRSRETFAKHGDIIGHDLMQYHTAHAQAKIREMLAEGTTNTYTVEKNGVKKLIHQTPWRDEEGKIAGLVEFSTVLPADMPHYVRTPQK